jgi:hypothetical protein
LDGLSPAFLNIGEQLPLAALQYFRNEHLVLAAAHVAIASRWPELPSYAHSVLARRAKRIAI